MNQITRQRADELLRNASERFIVVYGDVMLDEFVWGDVTRISPEAPVPVVDIRRESVRLGGAANVLANLVALGARGRGRGGRPPALEDRRDLRRERARAARARRLAPDDRQDAHHRAQTTGRA